MARRPAAGYLAKRILKRVSLARIATIPYVADIAVSCEALGAEDRLLSAPLLVVEVLSPGTSISDRQLKLFDYRRIPTVEESLLIDSRSMFAEVHRPKGTTEIVRAAKGCWL